jgi:hypothetical protein
MVKELEYNESLTDLLNNNLVSNKDVLLISGSSLINPGMANGKIGYVKSKNQSCLQNATIPGFSKSFSMMSFPLCNFALSCLCGNKKAYRERLILFIHFLINVKNY